ncbi:putative redox protein, regulator of disulfide bond formation [Desulfitobacterium dichloroeliminans LMG P-21439]|uniref:Putative redox protein, regulator of disulfide bond formation n=1 Tax=Desulfitobacterium dichloroeliminans (strain LMG P-21439 / DCA1) TaxID=871963 RepID=L0F463_DESDL|nr:OsmC family protein [Desulfitobacterium dichloroeliminans]AGA68614.1 putative redox protein, regulator of disulfide bond formation [Desulfitobacterium dichloroeliminans LMG P-21439]
MRITVKHAGGMAFEGMGHSGESVKISSSTAVSEHLGASPMELVLMGVAGCSGIDIVSILEKMRVNYEKFEIYVDGQRAEEHPKVFTDIQVVYQFWGNDLPEEKISRAIELSFNKYCSVIHTVNKVAQVSYKYEVHSQNS